MNLICDFLLQEIGTFGLQALVEELRRDGEDEETAKVCLETLNIIFSPSQDEEDAGIEVQFCEIFLKVSGFLDVVGAVVNALFVLEECGKRSALSRPAG